MAKARSSDTSDSQKPPALRTGKSGHRNPSSTNTEYDHRPTLSPPFVPDEALISDVGRYHILSANRTITATFQELFQCAPFSLNAWIPPHIATLASRMPGDVVANTRYLLERKTLYPLFQLFSALSLPEHRSRRSGKKSDDLIAAPKRFVAEPVRICLACLHEDIRTYGVPYIHLSHQIPGVGICAWHGIDLIFKCPNCACRFSRSRQLALAPWTECHCHYYLRDFSPTSKKSNNLVALSYAKFTRDLLAAAPILIQPQALVECYKRRIRELGYVWGAKIHRVRLFKEIEEFYGADCLAMVDPAYKGKRLSGWFMLINEHYVSECPLSRHLLLAHFLFRQAGLFWPAILQAVEPSPSMERDASSPITVQRPRRTIGKKDSKVQTKAQRVRELMRQLLHVARGIPKCTIDDLWHSKFGLMKRLMVLDSQAVHRLKEQLTKLKPNTRPASRGPVQPHPEDEARAKEIEQAAKKMYESPDKPELVSGNRLHQKLGWAPYTSRRDLFPQRMRALDEQVESKWHFYARRIVWAMLCLRQGSPVAVHKLAGVEYHRSLVLIEFFRDLDTSVSLSSGVVVKLLQQYGIGRQWEGPCPEREFPPAGRRFYENR